jgi:hypothetical protein
MQVRPRFMRVMFVGVLVLGASLVLLLPSVVGGWAPVLHVSCNRGVELVGEQLWTPAVLANSPYGGMVYDNGTIPPYVPGAPGYPNAWSALGAPADNGTAAGAFFITNVSIYLAENVTHWGPGPNDRCAHQYLTDFLPLGGGEVGSIAFAPINTTSNLSDEDEATSAPFGAPSFVFENGFTAQNSQMISTCGRPAEWLPVSAPDFTVWARANLAEVGSLIPVELPFQVSFNYWFPSDGTWEVDNLSLPGGPGGGWAFAYSPCP